MTLGATPSPEPTAHIRPELPFGPEIVKSIDLHIARLVVQGIEHLCGQMAGLLDPSFGRDPLWRSLQEDQRFRSRLETAHSAFLDSATEGLAIVDALRPLVTADPPELEQISEIVATRLDGCVTSLSEIATNLYTVNSEIFHEHTHSPQPGRFEAIVANRYTLISASLECLRFRETGSERIDLNRELVRCCNTIPVSFGPNEDQPHLSNPTPLHSFRLLVTKVLDQLDRVRRELYEDTIVAAARRDPLSLIETENFLTDTDLGVMVAFHSMQEASPNLIDVSRDSDGSIVVTFPYYCPQTVVPKLIEQWNRDQAAVAMIEALAGHLGTEVSITEDEGGVLVSFSLETIDDHDAAEHSLESTEQLFQQIDPPISQIDPSAWIKVRTGAGIFDVRVPIEFLQEETAQNEARKHIEQALKIAGAVSGIQQVRFDPPQMRPSEGGLFESAIFTSSTGDLWPPEGSALLDQLEGFLPWNQKPAAVEVKKLESIRLFNREPKSPQIVVVSDEELYSSTLLEQIGGLDAQADIRLLSLSRNITADWNPGDGFNIHPFLEGLVKLAETVNKQQEGKPRLYVNTINQVGYLSLEHSRFPHGQVALVNLFNDRGIRIAKGYFDPRDDQQCFYYHFIDEELADKTIARIRAFHAATPTRYGHFDYNEFVDRLANPDDDGPPIWFPLEVHHTVGHWSGRVVAEDQTVGFGKAVHDFLSWPNTFIEIDDDTSTVVIRRFGCDELLCTRGLSPQ